MVELTRKFASGIKALTFSRNRLLAAAAAAQAASGAARRTN
jgi:hypothetical protein